MYNLKLPILSFFILFCFNLSAQTFEEKLKKADELRDTDPVESNTILADILATDSASVPVLVRARALQLLGLSEMYNKQFDAANQYFSRSLNLYDYTKKDENSTQQKASLIFDIGRILTWQAKYDSALQNFIVARELFLAVDYSKGVATALNAIAIIYAQFNEDYKSALGAFREAVALHGRLNDTLSMARTMQNIGQLYQLIDQQDSALYYLDQSNIYCERYEDYRSLAIGSNMIGTVYHALNQLDSAERYFRKAIDLNVTLKDSIGLESDYTWLGKTYFEKKDYPNAEKYAKLVYHDTKDLSRKFEVAKLLSDIYEKTSKSQLALSFYKKYKFYQDSVKSEKQHGTIAELQTKYETERKEQEIESLQLSNKLAKAEISQARWQMIVILGGSILLVVIAIFLYWLKTKKDKAERVKQGLQFEALQKRYIELLNGPATVDLTVDLEAFNERLVTPLTEREFDVLRYSMNGKTNQEAADALHVSLSTVKFHLGNVYHKLGVNNKKEALEYVVKSS